MNVLTKTRLFISTSLILTLTLTGCNTTAPFIFADSDYQEFERLFNMTMVGREASDLLSLWSFPNEFSKPSKTIGEKKYWPIQSRCAYFAVEQNGKIVGLSKEYNSSTKKFGIVNLSGKKGYYDEKFYDVSRCLIPKIKLEKLAKTGSLQEANKSDFKIFGIQLDKSTIKDFLAKNSRCDISKIKNNTYQASKNCLPLKARFILIKTNKDDTISKMHIVLDMGKKPHETNNDYKAVLLETYGPSLNWYKNGLNWWINNTDIAYYRSTTEPANYIFEVQSAWAPREDLIQQHQEAVQRQIDHVEATLEDHIDKQYRKDKIRKALQ